jgi:hypothetical protein
MEESIELLTCDPPNPSAQIDRLNIDHYHRPYAQCKRFWLRRSVQGPAKSAIAPGCIHFLIVTMIGKLA